MHTAINLKRLIIHITYRCNLACNHCFSLVHQAPDEHDMPLETIMRLIVELASNDYKCERIILHGGEPTLHPRFKMICALLHGHKQLSDPTVDLILTTNGHGDIVQQGIRVAEQYGFRIENSFKTGRPDWDYHFPFCSSPVDTGEARKLGCYQPGECGICYNQLGFFECTPAASMARVFGFDAPVKSMKELTEENLSKGFVTHCLHCGLSRCNLKTNPNAPMSKTWKESLERYNQTR